MFALQPEPEHGQRWRTLAVGVLLGSIFHGSVLAATSMLEARPVARPPVKIQLRLNAVEPRPPEAALPPTAPPPTPPPQATPKPLRPAPSPPPPVKAMAPEAVPSPPTSTPPLVVGLTLSSTSSFGSGGRYAVGNTALGTPGRVAKPLSPKPPPANVAPVAPETKRGASSKSATEATMSRTVSPVYPALARREGVEGVVVVAVTIGASGEVESVTVLRGLGYGLDESAMRAVRESAWTPGSLDGRAVRTTRRLNIRFSLQS